MEVLKHGKFYKEMACKACDAVIGYTDRDIEYKTIRDALHDGVHETSSEFIYCPECGCRLVLSLRIDGVDREIRGNN